MRLRLMAIIAGMCVAGPAAASSFVVLPAAEPGPSPSIVFLGEPAASDTSEPAESSTAEIAGAADGSGRDGQSGPPAGPLPYHISPSILSYGEPAVEDMKVSSIDDEPRDARRGLPPMVIRGGIVGDAFASSPSGSAAPEIEEGPEQASTDGNAPARSPQPEPAERPAAAPPPAPSRPPPGGLDVPR